MFDLVINVDIEDVFLLICCLILDDEWVWLEVCNGFVVFKIEMDLNFVLIFDWFVLIFVLCVVEVDIVDEIFDKFVSDDDIVVVDYVVEDVEMVEVVEDEVEVE